MKKLLDIANQQYPDRYAYLLAMDAGIEKAYRRMRKAGREAWDEEDWALSTKTFERVYQKLSARNLARQTKATT
jgi:hypothetical protein